MGPLEAVQRLALKAREEEVPATDVADRVLRQIRSEQEDTFGFIVFDLFASISALAASIVGYFSVGALKFITSPLMQFFAPLQEARLW